MDKNLNLLYFSPTNTTKKVVRSIAKGMDMDYEEHNITLLKERNKSYEFGQDDLLIVGVPVYGGRIPIFLEKVFRSIKGNNTPAIFVTVYGNRDYDDALLELKNIFEDNGFIGIAAGAFIGEHSYTKKLATNRPDNKDMEIANDFGRKIMQLLKDEKIEKARELKIKGNEEYKERGPAANYGPETNEDCIDCAICAENCPTEAISFENFRDIEEDKCIKCCSCVKICPTDAKVFTDERFKTAVNYLVSNFAKERREPDIYI